MNKLIAPLVILIASGCADEQTPYSDLQPCTAPWQEYVEAQLQTGDSEGHGPDLGSLEWRSVVEFKLGIRGDPTIPSRATDEWCTYIDQAIRNAAS